MLRLRRENFDQHAGPDTRDGRQLVPGRSWAAWARALGHLLPPLEVVDIGCGEGYLTDRSRALGAPCHCRRSHRRRSSRAPRPSPAVAARTNITFKRGELDKLPLEPASVDVALLSQALHHCGRSRADASPRRRASCARADRCSCSTCARTTKHWVRDKLGDRQLGFSDEALSTLLTEARPDRHARSASARGAPATPSPFSSRSGVNRRPKSAAPGRNIDFERHHDHTTPLTTLHRLLADASWCSTAPWAR